MNSIKINYDKEELEIDGEKIIEPVIVKIPQEGKWQKAKIFNHKKGWKRGELLPCISITFERQGRKERYLKCAESREDTFEIIVKGLTEDEKTSLKEVVDKEIRRIKYRRHKEKASSLRYEIDLNL